MTYKWQVGQMMVVTRQNCFHTDATGTIERRGMFYGVMKVYELSMPQFSGIPCASCGGKCLSSAPFAEDELRPLKDPDDNDERTTEEKLENPLDATA